MTSQMNTTTVFTANAPEWGRNFEIYESALDHTLISACTTWKFDSVDMKGNQIKVLQ